MTEPQQWWTLEAQGGVPQLKDAALRRRKQHLAQCQSYLRGIVTWRPTEWVTTPKSSIKKGARQMCGKLFNQAKVCQSYLEGPPVHHWRHDSIETGVSTDRKLPNELVGRVGKWQELLHKELVIPDTEHHSSKKAQEPHEIFGAWKVS